MPRNRTNTHIISSLLSQPTFFPAYGQPDAVDDGANCDAGPRYRANQTMRRWWWWFSVLFVLHTHFVCVCAWIVKSRLDGFTAFLFGRCRNLDCADEYAMCLWNDQKEALYTLLHMWYAICAYMLSIGLIPHGYAFCLLDVTSSVCDWGEQKMSRTSLLCAKIHWPHRDEPKTDRQGFVEPAESFLFVFFCWHNVGVCVSVWIVCVSLVNDQPQYVRQIQYMFKRRAPKTSITFTIEHKVYKLCRGEYTRI